MHKGGNIPTQFRVMLLLQRQHLESYGLLYHSSWTINKNTNMKRTINLYIFMHSLGLIV